MKRSIFKIFIVASALLVGSSPKAFSDAPPTTEARLTRVEGNVYLHLRDHPFGTFIAAEEGAPIEEGDRILTGADGLAEVSLGGESLIQVESKSDFTVKSLAPARTEFHLGLGTLLAKIRSLLPDQHLEFSTPVAVAAVRGTELAIAQEEGKPAHVGVFDEGHVAVTSSGKGGGGVTVGPGQETEVRPSGKPAKAHPLQVFLAQRDKMTPLRKRREAVHRNWVNRSPEEIREIRNSLRKKPSVEAQVLEKAGVQNRKETPPPTKGRSREPRPRTTRKN